MLFESFGPFEIDRNFEGQWKREFWLQVDERLAGLRNSVGCYAFCLQHGETVKPWYVGQTINKAGFEGEVFTDHKREHYSYLLELKPKSRPVMLLFPLVTDNWKLSKNRSSSKSVIDWLETTLIGMALSKNPEIANVSKTRFHREVYVHGVIGSQFQGKPSTSASFAKKAFTKS
tara:strand:- start:46 stop:567 length:522 start_codon:yes stop_codon:yes gene_type:complete